MKTGNQTSNNNEDVVKPNNCHICGEVPENFITLKCYHDICIECTANNLK